MAARKPLSFDVGDPAPVPQAAPATPAARAPKLAVPQENEERQQVGARIKQATYRQLKARAALEGRRVQELVEVAVERYLAGEGE